MVKVYCKIESRSYSKLSPRTRVATNIVSSRLSAPGSPRMDSKQKMTQLVLKWNNVFQQYFLVEKSVAYSPPHRCIKQEKYKASFLTECSVNLLLLVLLLKLLEKGA